MSFLTSPAALTSLAKRFHRLPGHLIDGEWVVPSGSSETFSVFNPATGELICDVANGQAADVDAAVRAARRALEGPWGKTSDVDRARLLFDLARLVEIRAEELALIETLDNGKPVRQALEVDIATAIFELRENAGWATS